MNRLAIFIICAYAAVVAVVYFSFPPLFESVWYYSYFSAGHPGLVPYIDFQEGYPVLGAFPYYILFVASNSFGQFALAFRYLNLALLVAAMILVYDIVRRCSTEKDAVIATLAVAISVSVVITNGSTNVVICTFFALGAIALHLRSRPALSGGALAAAFFALGLPIFIAPILLILLRNWPQRFRWLAGFGLSALLVNVSFIVLNPFMWISTFTSTAARGPWWTIWAIAAGYFGDGGGSYAIHPVWEFFVTAGQQSQIYANLPAGYQSLAGGYAYFQYPSPLIPLLADGILVLALVLPPIVARIRGGGLAPALGLGTGLFFLGYTGYSPEFTILTLPLIAIAAPRRLKIPLCVTLDAVTVLGLMNAGGWWSTIIGRVSAINGDTMLYTVVLTTFVFLALTEISLRPVYSRLGRDLRANMSLLTSSSINSIRRALRTVRRSLPTLAAFFVVCVVGGAIVVTSSGVLAASNSVIIQSYSASTSPGVQQGITINHTSGERAYVWLPEGNWNFHVNASAVFSDVTYNLTRIMVLFSDSGQTSFGYELLYPLSNFSTNEVLQSPNGTSFQTYGTVNYRFVNNSLLVRGTDPTTDDVLNIYMDFTVSGVVTPDASILASTTLLTGNPGVFLTLSNVESGYFYGVRLIPPGTAVGTTTNFTANSSTPGLNGEPPLGNFSGQPVSSVLLGMFLGPNQTSTVAFHDVSFGGNSISPSSLGLGLSPKSHENVTVYLAPQYHNPSPWLTLDGWVLPGVFVIAVLSVPGRPPRRGNGGANRRVL